MRKITINLKRQTSNFCALAAFIMAGQLALAQPYVNGNLSTGATSKSGVAAPTGYTWSELQNDLGVSTMSNGTTGVGAQYLATGGNRVADDFTVPAGQVWNLTKITVYAYQTGYAGTVSPFVDIRLRIQNAIPSSAASVVVFGDLTTNRLLTTSDAMMYRIGNTVAPAPTTPLTNRRIWKIEANVPVALSAGTYWIEYQLDAGANSNFVPPSTVVDARTQPGYNAIQWIGASSVWNTLADSGNPADSTPDVAIDMPFVIDYSLTLNTSEKSFAAGISLYPNPVQNMLNISSTEIIDGAEIFDITGRLVKTVKFTGLVSNSINVSALSGGNYIVKLSSGNNVVSRKFIKE